MSDCSPSEVTEVSDDPLQTSLKSLSAMREAYLALGSLGPDQVADLIESLPESSRTEAEWAFAVIGNAAAALEPLVRSAEMTKESREHVRWPRADEPQKINLESVVVLLKQSKLGYDMRMRGIGREELLRQYELEGVDVEKILASNAAHLESIERIKETFRVRGVEPRFHVLDELEEDEIPALFENAEVVVSIGGDDHFKAVAHHVTSQFVVVVNSDPKRSDGALTYFNAQNFESLVRRLTEGEFLIEEWKRVEGVIETTVNGDSHSVIVPPAVSEISIADHETQYTMRGMLQHGDKETLLKGSGMLVVTGAGSTGWFTSAGKYLFPSGRRWLRTADRAEYLHREPYGKNTPMQDVWGVLGKGEELCVISSSNHSPEVSVDSVWSHPFPRDSRLRMWISEAPLKVISRESLGEISLC